MSSTAGFRNSLLLGIGLLLLVVLGFAAVTVLGRDRWSRLGTWESLLARLSAAVVLACLSLGGASLILSVVAGPFLSRSSLTDTRLLDGRLLEIARIQTVIGLLLALGVAAGGVVWIEMYHRRAIAVLRGGEADEADEWKVEEPGVAGQRFSR